MIAELLGLGRRESRYSGGFTLENPNLPLNSPEIWEQVFNDSWGTATGESMTHAKAMRYAPVWQAVSLISGDVAKLPLNLYERKPELSDDARELARDDERQRLVKLMANEEVNAVKFWRRAMVHALLWGNGYAWVERDVMGAPVAMYNLLPDRTCPERIDGDLYYVTESGGKLRPMLPRDVVHIEGMGYEKGMGVDLVQAARDSFALGLAQQNFASKFFKNGGRVGGILELPAAMHKTARDNIEEGFRKTYEGGENPFKTVILRDGAKFHSAQTTPRESQFTEATEEEVRQVARWFNLQPSKLGLSDSVSYNSKAEDNQAYLDSTLSIWLLLIATECNTKLLTDGEQGGMYFEHNANALLRLNQYQRYQSYEVGIRSQFLSPNEVRARENMLPYEGGDEYINPNRSPDASSPRKDEETQKPAPVVDEVAKQAMNGAQVSGITELLGKAAQGELPVDAVKAVIAAAYPWFTDAQVSSMTTPLAGFTPTKPEPPTAPATTEPVDPNRSRIVFGLTKVARARAHKGTRSFCDWIDNDLPNERAEAKKLLGDDAIVGAIVERFRKLIETSKESALVADVEQLSQAIERGE